MSVASEITALTNDRNNIRTALVNKGISAASGHGYDSFAGDIAAIPAASQSQEKTATPSESQQEITPDSGYLLSKVTVGAIASDYVGSGVARKSSSDLTSSGATVTAPAGYYAQAASKAVASGTAGTPTATKGAVSNHSVSVTPSVTNTGGYISGGTKTGTAVTVSVSELVSGSETKTENGTYDVTNLAELIVNVSGGGGGTSYTLVHEQDVADTMTGTSAASLVSITLSGVWTKAKMIYVRVRDKAGPRAGYFYGSDSFLMNYSIANGATTAISTAARLIHRYSTSSQWGLYCGGSTTGYGIYPYDINSSGRIRIYHRYNANYSLTIDGTYHIEIYTLDWPDNVSPYN